MDKILKRNWEIDLLRFVFAICIVLFHFKDQLPTINGIRLGFNGYIGVEFFFVVSGYLLAKKILSAKEEIGVFEIAKSKLLSFYWIWVIAVVLRIVTDNLYGVTSGYERYIGDFLLLYSTGLTDVVYGIGWYLSSMMIMTIVLTPVLLKIKKRDRLKQDFVYLALIDICLIVGYLFLSLGTKDGLFMKFNVRALTEMMLGVVLYIFRQNVKPKEAKLPPIFARLWSIFLTVLSCIYLLVFMNNTYPEKGYGEFIALICIAIIIYFAFGNYGSSTQPNKYKKAWVYFCICLGRLSLPIYLFHCIVRSIFNLYFPDMNQVKKLCLIIAVTIWLSVAVLVLKHLCDYLTSRIKSDEAMKTEKNICLCYLVVSVLMAVICPIASIVADATVKDSFYAVKNSVSYDDKSSTVKCYTGTTVSEEFYIEDNSVLFDISFYTITWNKKFTDDQTMKIVIRDKDTSEEVYSATKKMSEFKDGKLYPLTPDETVTLSGDSWYTIEFIPTTSESQEYMALMMTRSSDNSGKAYINGKQTDEHISMQIQCVEA